MTVLGLFAGALTTLAFLPQVMRTIRTRSARDLSWAWIVMMCAGVGTWFVYGLLGADLPVIVANGITLVLVAALGVIKGLHERTTSP
ncbi:SemiSWEET transporter [Kibdelosporangium persicum]|uniref:Sugar efflux transporter for intercellular exchange n=1 Tax=Kibdelosporangium persicum TaxID=2698649 RepID=A0ABX2EW61_9PSEU|nr:SemiSWEET transporter [Kibdelosporangium persicum]NRN63065.1 Sugar efflux transporter for intercellular exchange [Kibdelosporangium persicum]